MKLTPLQWQMLLHYHAIVEPYAARDPNYGHSIAVLEQRDNLVRRELLIQDDNRPSGYKATDKAHCLIRHICDDLPEPIQRWAMPD